MPVDGNPVWESKYAAYQVPIRNKQPIYEYGVQVGEIREIWAEFGTFGQEYQILDANGDPVADPDGEMRRHVDIRGYVFDLNEQAERKGWTDDECELVVKKLDWQCTLTPDAIWRRTRAKAAAPWPTYDQTHHNQIPLLAEQLGLVAEALSYERQEKNRESVTSKLEEAIEQAQAQAELTVA